jgi:glycosyltransferase involved in cell wall biosynthesis
MTHSVIVPLFNKTLSVVETLESLVMQIKQPDELIIIDDASTDDGLAIAKAYLQQQTAFCENCRVVIIELTENKGAGNARNIGMACATGELISFLDADDLYHPYLLSIANWKFGAEKLDLMILNMECMSRGETYPDMDALRKYLYFISEDLYGIKDPLRAVISPHFTLGVGSNVIVKSKWLKLTRYIENASFNEGIDFWYSVLKGIPTEKQGNVTLLTGNYLKVREVKGSLSGKIYPSYKEIELPPVISRYKHSKDINDRLLIGIVGRRWYVQSINSLRPVKQKLFFIFHYSYLLPQFVGYAIMRMIF